MSAFRKLKASRKTSSSSSRKFSSSWVNSSAPITTTTSTQRLSEDHRRRVERSKNQPLPSPEKRRKTRHDQEEVPEELYDEALLAQLQTLDEDENTVVCWPERAQKRRRRRKAWESDQPMRDLRARADQIIAGLLYLKGRGDAVSWKCPGCHSDEPPTLRCEGCFGASLYCEGCCLKAHRQRPFCRLEKWDGESFRRTSLKTLGHRIQLGHPDGAVCPCPRHGVAEFTIVHVNGLHTCSVDFCACTNGLCAGDDIDQLLRRGLFPATTRDPQTCFTFELLKHYTALSLQGKTTQYDYYTALEKLTDVTGTTPVKDRYSAFCRCARVWRFATRAKRSGNCNVIGARVDSLPSGSLAVECPACPRPGVNLPANWKEASWDKEFLYTKTLCLDACFRLKRRQISSWERDPALGDGMSYLVESQPFERYLKEEGRDQNEISTCHGLSALEHANTKFSRGYAETGKVIGVCARHEFVQKNGVVATQVGERYINTDYALASLLSDHVEGQRIILSYDICCQYSKNLVERMAKLPDRLRRKLDVSRMRFVIPKLHIHGHKLECQLAYNFNYTLGAGRTDGEGVERPWSQLGPLGTALRAMGPGSAADMLDDHIGYLNFMKLTGLGRLLRRRAIDALEELARQAEELRAFTEGQASYVEGWAATVIAFERDPSVFNPFELPKTGLTEADVELQLATEDEDRARKGLNRRHDMSASAFVIAAIQVEHEQRVLHMEVEAKRYSSTAQQTELARKRVKLANTIANLRDHQAVYSPRALQRSAEWSDDPANANVPIEQQPLFLPSALSPEDRASCLDDVVGIEYRIRDAQCQTSLDMTRNLLLIKARMLTFKNANLRAQGATTRARASIGSNDEKIQVFARKYVDARAAFFALKKDDEEPAHNWHALDPKKDLRCMQDPEGKGSGSKRTRDEEEGDATRSHLQTLRDATGEGRRVISWIWTGVDTAGQEGGAMYEGLRVEWCKAFSRVRRWAEEVPLLNEEMRRVLVTLRVRATRWDTLKAADTRVGAQAEGARAYASSQARVYRALADHFEHMWNGLYDSPRMGAPNIVNGQLDTQGINIDEIASLRAQADAEEDAELEDAEDNQECEEEDEGEEEDEEEEEEG
ncbi:hypothetical protein BD626DRAFT_579197 [Schizophyllum amplum]|uniref:CxC2-like cysteine cluster KDZ transposase-associated domain-containing protein n=1 Tax=Schizophyllum amplum TaxID=97359 RepID=A0A550BRL1_9AGAR|nr:hypothetical protein BD626DRAFT_579197 [Auriculariopsis ampla]